MTIQNEEHDFNVAFCARIKSLREGKNVTAEQMATVLGIPADRYRKYETRSPMPAYLIERFALFVGKDVLYVLTGRQSLQRLRPVAPTRPKVRNLS